MMDLLLVQQYPVSKICSFLTAVFDCSSDRIKIFSVAEFNSLNEELDDSLLDCVCVFSSIKGDVSQLLQLYKYKISDPEATTRTVDIALKNKIHCYVPDNSFDGWIYVGDSHTTRRAKQIASDEDDCFLFKLI